MDPIVTAAIAYAGKDGINKLLGPTFEYYGNGLKNIIESFNAKAKKNIKNIFDKAIVKKGEKINEDGFVNPRILKEVILEGAFCDAEILQEYYSGILSHSRNLKGTDDNIYFLKLLKGLSSREIKLHYIIYYKYVKENLGKDYNLHSEKSLTKRKVRISVKEMFILFGLEEQKDINILTEIDIPALYNSGLLDRYKFITDDLYFEFVISFSGMALFIQAIGNSDISVSTCLKSEELKDELDKIKSIGEV